MYFLSAVQRIRFSDWKRPSDLSDGKELGIFANINSCDIQQGQIGDCYLLSSLGILATKENSGFYPGILKDIITPNDHYPANGAFLVRFYKRGREISV